MGHRSAGAYPWRSLAAWFWASSIGWIEKKIKKIDLIKRKKAGRIFDSAFL
jgi:hypothetical protein